MTHHRLLASALLLLCASPAFAQTVASSGTPPGLDFVNVRVSCVEPVLLPEPTGSHQVGRVTYHWVDLGRDEVASDDPYDKRQVIADVYYPAVRTRDDDAAPYLPELDMLRRGFASDTREFPRQLAEDMGIHGCVRTSSFADLPVAEGDAFPVLLFSPGGNMSRHWHTALAQELASQGYVVAVMSHAHSGMDVFPRGGFLMSSPYWNAAEDAPPGEAARLDDELAETLAADAIFTLDRLAEMNDEDPNARFTGRLNLERVAILGHSRGGSTVARACSNDVRFRACIVHDNVGPEREVAAGLPQPQLLVRRPWNEARVATVQGYLDRNRTAGYDVVIEGTIHNSFSDLPLVDRAGNEADIQPERAHRIIAEVTLAFLREHLDPGEGPGLAEAVDGFEEANVRGFGEGRADRNGMRPPSGAMIDPGAESGFEAARAFADSVGTDAYLLMIDGDVVAAHGDLEREYRLHSVRKSLLASLYGVAEARGTVDTARTLGSLRISDHGGGLTDEERSATVRHLLQSRSGVFLPATYESAAFDGVRPARHSHAPGAHWFYSNWDFNAAGTAYQIMTGEGIFSAFARDVARPIGMQDFTTTDGGWRYSTRSRHPAYVFRMSTRDLARFGELVLQGGEWEGKQVIPSDWVSEMTRWHSQATRPDGEIMPGDGYGLMWWILPPTKHGVLLGPGAFEASGTGTQLLLIAPARQLVFVHRNDTDGPSEEYRSVSTSETYRILELLLQDLGSESS